MKIRNTRPYDLYLPYAGKRKGFRVGAGKFSMDLPTDRFYDPLLQRDWKAGKIEVLLSETDKAILGPVVATLQSEEVDVTLAPVIPVTVETLEMLNPETGEATQVDLPPPEVKPAADPAKPNPKFKVRKPKPEPKNALKHEGASIRVYQLGQELGLTTKAVVAEMRRRSMTVSNHNSNVTPEDADILRNFFTTKRLTDSGMATLEPGAPVGRGVPTFSDITPAAGRSVKRSNSPSLTDLQQSNAKLTLGQPNFSGGSVTGKARIEMPGGSPFGSPLQSGPPKSKAQEAVGAQ